MKLTRIQLRQLINEAISSGLKAAKREVGNSSFQKAQEDAKKSGKAYFVKNDSEVVAIDKEGNASVVADMTGKDAFDANDGTVHYKGSL
jgi:hypothetical protein